MKKSLITFVASLAVFSLAMTFSISIQPTHAQTVNCPAGYTCTPIAAQPVGCPVGYTCTPVNVSSATPTPPSNTTNSCYSLPTNLYLGSTGSTVANLQTWLMNNGFDIPAVSSGKTGTGYYGSQTVSATARYKMSSRYQNCFGAQNQAPVWATTTNPVTYTPPVLGSPTQSSITVISPKQGDVLQVGTPVQVNWGGSWSGNDSFNIMWSAKGQGGSVASHVSQAQAGCTGYGKGVCGIMWTPQTQADQVQITVARGTNGNTNDYGSSGWFSVVSGSSNTVNQPTISSVYPTTGSSGTQVTVYGSGFTSTDQVSFSQNGLQLASTVIQSATSNQIIFTLSNILVANVNPGTYQLSVWDPQSKGGAGSNSVNFVIGSGSLTPTSVPVISVFNGKAGDMTVGSVNNVTGQYFSGITSAYLNGSDSGGKVTYTLGYTINSDSSVNLTLPSSVPSGQYSLLLVNSAGTSQPFSVDVWSGTSGQSSTGDLAVTDFSWTPINPTVGQSDPYIYFTMSIKNVGTGPLYVPSGTDFTITYNGLLVAQDEIGTGAFTLAPGESKVFSNVTSTQGSDLLKQAGTYTLTFDADAGNLIHVSSANPSYVLRESNLVQEATKSNNSMTKQISILPSQSSSPTQNTVAITPSQLTINPASLGQPSNTYLTLTYPSNATNETVSITCNPYGNIFGDCNVGPIEVIGENTFPLASYENLGTTSQQFTVTYTVTTPQGNTSAQTQVTVLPGKQ